jgi:tetratricopeptide (TPR) repeat protein
MVEWLFNPSSGINNLQFATPEGRAAFEAQAGDQLYNQNKFNLARLRYQEAARLQPGVPQHRWRVALCEWSEGLDDRAGMHLQELAADNPEFAFGHSSLAEWYLVHGMVESALDASAKAIALSPDNVGVRGARAKALTIAGKMDAALDLVVRSVDSGQITAPMVELYAQMAARHGQVERAYALLKRLLADGGLSNETEYSLRFTLVGLLENLGHYDEAFAEATHANKRLAGTFDCDAHERLINGRIAFFTPLRAQSLPRATYRSDKPVLVVGMPRSGTSLVEQILASHPAVYGAGELDLLHWTFMGTLKMLRANLDEYPACLTGMSLDQVDGMAQIYLEPLLAMKPSAARIIDKMPFNFLNLGLVSVLLPGARIIHCRRDPVATCVSCYMAGFSVGKEFKGNLKTLGRFYRLYQRLMDHWKSVLDLRILDVDYEEVVADTAGQARRMVDFLGLPWDDRCLKFYETERPCATASAGQVRRPIYKSSLERWRHYEKYLGPLLEGLGP